MDERAQTCCFTGHRPMKLPWGMNEDDPRCLMLKAELAARLEGLYALGFRRFLCGMAIGCDMYFAEKVLELREEHPDVILEAAVPCDSQAERWSRAQQLRYRSLLEQCDEVHYVSHVYTPDCMLRRNEYMIDRSSLLLACFGGKTGGTMKTILYAMRTGVETVILDIP